uniref:P-type domain-containing protein n=2 Tax=Leptobrachium leishanense TaxID=445787 RepID=A0A8C5LY52_9ANUR
MMFSLVVYLTSCIVGIIHLEPVTAYTVVYTCSTSNPEERRSCGSTEECPSDRCCFDDSGYGITCFEPVAQYQDNGGAAPVIESQQYIQPVPVVPIAIPVREKTACEICQEEPKRNKGIIMTAVHSVFGQHESEACARCRTENGLEQHRCGVQPKSRDECGYSDISPEECEHKGCCYDNSVQDSIWCFTPWKFEATECNPENPPARVNCGYSGITEKDCTDKGCCFNNTIWDVVWCYQPAIQAVEHDCSAVDPYKRANCASPGVSPEECKNNGCCFDSSVSGVPWCFKPQIKRETIQCAVEGKARVNCADSAIDMENCYKKGCCYDSSESGIPWCFYPEITNVVIMS